MTSSSFPLWSDEPATTDLLAFNAVAETAADAIFNDALDPVAIGLSGAWGSGKTSVLELIKAEIETRSGSSGGKVLVVSTQPWRYDPTVGPKESLIAEVLETLGAEFKEEDPVGKAGLDAFKKLVKKVNWSKAVKMTATTAITMQLPKLDDIFGLVSDDPESLESERGMAAFRDEFEKLLRDPALAHVSRIVVLVDDLDRCLPDTVVESLEAIRLFLSAKGMSFVIAADEDRVAEAIQQRFKSPPSTDVNVESPAKLYLHKIVQTTIPLPALSRFDTHAYLFLLLSQDRVSPEVHAALVESCGDLRRSSGSLDDVSVPGGIDLTDELAVAARLTPILYEKFRGNPRRIKRFLNDLNVRQSIANRRGITLSSDAVAKLMVLERLLFADFQTVLDWLAQNKLRDKLEALDQVANTPASPPEDGTDQSTPDGADAPSSSSDMPEASGGFSDTLIRWAKLPPALDASEVGGYLYLAASFSGIELIDEELPERLRDIASALTATLRTDRSAVDNAALSALNAQDARTLVTYLGRQTRDHPSIQKYSVNGMLRLADTHHGIDDAVVSALKLIPPPDVQVATIMLLKSRTESAYEPVFTVWDVSSATDQARQTIASVRRAWGQSNGN
ncbi:hypothetical protein J2W54_002370 [Rhodococcus fascians]|uniref:KAP family P-loop NTPase fold protein n=1 Tax=Nocardiaceae TaxID=85025 RepID=UPI0028566243|nr:MULTISPECIES: P-loop NTPase fold protein [Rhodococcus]MDR6910645.1 hypothetical protein [Rhodococcus sp. 3258]MDR6931988.1 hypothetical protein [Rhodococcus fascians]